MSKRAPSPAIGSPPLRGMRRRNDFTLICPRKLSSSAPLWPLRSAASPTTSPSSTHALGEALGAAEQRATAQELQDLDTSAGELFKGSTDRMGVAERLGNPQKVLERETPRSALILRRILGPIRLVPVTPQVGKPYYQSETTLQVLDLLEAPEGGSNWSQWWRWRVSNPRPETLSVRLLHP